jgi:hypothetical protein
MARLLSRASLPNCGNPQFLPVGPSWCSGKDPQRFVKQGVMSSVADLERQKMPKVRKLMNEYDSFLSVSACILSHFVRVFIHMSPC